MLLASNQDCKILLLIDVQSSIVRGTLIKTYFDKTRAPALIFSQGLMLPHKPNTDNNFLIKVTFKAISTIIDSVMQFLSHTKAYHPKICEVHYILSSPWIVSEAKNLRLNFDKPEKVTKKHILEAIENERTKLLKTDEKELSLVEEKVFDVKLNGYSVNDWEEKEAQRIDASFAISIGGTRTITFFEDALANVVRKSHIFFHSSLLLQHIGMQLIMPNRSDYMIIHVHGELTDVAVIQRHSCTFIGSYPFGVRSMVRKIGAMTGTDEHAGDSLLTLYTANHLDPVHAEKQAQIIRDVAETWMFELKKLFSSNNFSSNLPQIVLLSAWGHDEFFVSRYKESFPNSKVELLSLDSLKGHVDIESHIEHVRLMSIYAIAINNMLSK